MATLSFTTYFDVNQRKFRILDTSNYSGQSISIANVKGILKLTTPRGVTYETTSYTNPDVTPATSLYSGWIALPQNATGYILAGTYTIQYSIQDSGNGNAISTQTNSYTYSFIVPKIVIAQTPDGYNSTFESKDNTDYGSYTSLSRTHTVIPPSGSPLSTTSNSNATIDYAADIWSGEWASTITSVLVYTGSDGLIINCTITDTETIIAYNIDMNIIRGYIDIIRERYFTALDDDRTEAYELNSKILQINTAYSEYDLALYYNDLLTAYDRAVDIITQLSDIIPVGSSTEIIPFVNQSGGGGGGSGHNPVTINSTYAYGASITSNQVLSLGLATASHGGVIPQLVGGSTYYFGGDGSFHILTGGGDVFKTDFTAFDSVRAITATNITNWTTAYGWGNHATAGYALLANVYTKTNLQTSGQASVHWNNITNTPTTMAGYGITDGMQGNASISAATHTKITYDTKGLVTGGSDITASDIPSLNWSKITTGTPTTLSGYGITNAYTKTETINLTWAWSSITSTPTTIADYGITDAYTITQVNALTWPWSVITGTPTTLSGYGITDALSTSSAASSVINTGTGNKFLADNATYKYITFSGVSDKQVVFINGTTPAGSNYFIFDNVTDTLYTSNFVGDIFQVGSSIDFVGSDSKSGSSSGFRKWGDVRIKRANGQLIFKDHYYTKTLSQLVSASENYWTANGSNIYYGTGTSKVGINQPNPTAELEVIGHIIANYFDSNYFRYKNSNILIGTNAGDNETGNNLLYIANSNTTSPLIYGDFANQEIIFNADVYINEIKRLAFTDSTVSVRRDSLGNLEFRDLNANSGNPVTLTTLTTMSAGYALKSDFISYASVNSITAANLVTWGKASILTTAGAGTKFLTDDGTYQAGGGGVTPTDYTWKWDTGSVYYRPYTTKTEAGGVSSSGKFFNGTSDVTATNRLNYDGYLYATKLYSGGMEVQSALIFSNGLTNTSGIVKLGGTLTGVTLIDNSSYDLEFLASSNLSGVLSFQGGNGSQVICGYDYANIGHVTGGLFQITSTGALFSSGTGLGGIKYNANYSTNYTDRSLVDKGYVTGYAEPKLGNPSTNGYILSSTTAGIRSWIAPAITPVADILNWDTNKYTPYTVQGAGHFDNSSTNPTHTTRLNYDGILYQYGVRIGDNDYGTNFGALNPFMYSSSSYAAFFFVTNDNVASLYNTGVINQDNPNSILNLRRQTSGNFNITGSIINITDNPSGSGTRNYSTLQDTIGATIRIDMNPRIADGASSIAYLFDTNNTLSTTGAKLASWKNNGVEKVYLNKDGGLYAAGNTGIGTSNPLSKLVVYGPSGGYITDGYADYAISAFGNSVGVYAHGNGSGSKGIYAIGDGYGISATGSSYGGYFVGSIGVFSSGAIQGTAGLSNAIMTVPGILKDFYIDAGNIGTSETDLYSYTIPGNTLATNGDKITAEFLLYYAIATGTITAKFYFAGTAIDITTGNGSDIGIAFVIVTIIRVSSTVARIGISISDSTTLGSSFYQELTSKDWTITNILKITGQSNSSNKIIAKLASIEYKPAAIN